MPNQYQDQNDHNCLDGWVCEVHPDQAWPHEDCDGAGMLCSQPEHAGVYPVTS